MRVAANRETSPPGALGEAPAPAAVPTGAGGEARPARGGRDPAQPRSHRRLRLGRFVALLVLASAVILAVGYFTGVEVLAASGRFLWNALAAAVNSVTRVAGGLLAVLARGVGWRRLTRLAKVVTGVGLSYAGGVILSQRGLQRAQGWRDKARMLLASMRRTWLELALPWKLAIVAALIASQVYLHVVLIVFPIAFLLPVVRRVWVQAADIALGSWYWRMLGPLHRRIFAGLRGMPVVRQLIGGVRVVRIRYLTAWRLWKYHPRYCGAEPGTRQIDLVEPLRLWRRGELDVYVNRPLLAGGRREAHQSLTERHGRA